MFKGIPIRVATLQASQNGNGFFTGSVSGYCPSIPDDFDATNTSLTKTKSDLEMALVDYINSNDEELENVDLPGNKIQVTDLKHFYSEKNIHIESSTGNPVVVYYVSALVDHGLDDGAYIRYPRVLFDASDLTVTIHAILRVKRGQKQCSHYTTTCPKAKGGNRRKCGVTYGPRCDEVCLNASVRKNKCVLENDRINVKSVGNQWRRENAELVSFNCDEKFEDENNGGLSPAADAFYYAQVFYDVLQDWGKIERTEREPHTLFVHFGDGYPNSFWDGQSTTFGDGSEIFFPFPIPEVIGHEMCHAVTDSFGNLVFASESESVNEAFSDICGKAVTYYLDGEDAGWEFAKDLFKGGKKKALRYFDNPKRRKSGPVDHIEDYDPEMDPYFGVGIYGKAFYSIVAKQGILFRDAFEAFVFANQIYWNEETCFVDGACGVLRSASDLGLNTDAFKAGFNVVGIDLDFCDLRGTKDYIVPSSRNADGEIRRAQVSSSRSPKYYVQEVPGKSKIRVTVSGSGDQVVTINSGIISSNERSAVFPINDYTLIRLSADSHEIIDVRVRFEFE